MIIVAHETVLVIWLSEHMHSLKNSIANAHANEIKQKNWIAIVNIGYQSIFIILFSIPKLSLH